MDTERLADLGKICGMKECYIVTAHLFVMVE